MDTLENPGPAVLFRSLYFRPGWWMGISFSRLMRGISLYSYPLSLLIPLTSIWIYYFLLLTLIFIVKSIVSTVVTLVLL